MSGKYVYIHTIGCQMNVYDSECMAAGLAALGYQTASAPDGADLIIVNTCSIRAKAEHKAFSFLGRLGRLKKKNPHLIIGVGGCVAQQEGEHIFVRIPWVDLVFGTHAVGRLLHLIERVEGGDRRLVDVAPTGDIPEGIHGRSRAADGRATSMVTVMQGCDNYCTYCVVPYVRGREKSRSPKNILSEIRVLVSRGIREVTLLGQNVNSYGQKEGLCSFHRLLAMVHDIDGLERIRFTTSHPKDLSDALIESFMTLKKLCRHIHLPVQSGSDRILKRMNRRYTRDQYLRLIDALRYQCADIAITSDMIVGFPGETRADFKDTLELIHHVAFDGLYAFTYSDRPNAPAARFSEKVSETEKKERLQRLLECQEQFTAKKNQAMVGSTVRVLVEGFSKKHHADFPVSADGLQELCRHDLQWTGRTSGHKVVHFVHENGDTSCNKLLTGEMVQVTIKHAFSHSLWGKLTHVERRRG